MKTVSIHKIIVFLLIPMAGIFILLSSCKKDTLVTEPIATGNLYVSLDQFFQMNGAQPQYFDIIEPTIDDTITGKNGMVFIITGNTFVNANAQLPKGKIKVEIKEILNVKDMILSDKQTVSNGYILESGGEFYFNAVDSSGEILTIAPNKYIQIKIPNSNPSPNMEVFWTYSVTAGPNWSNYSPSTNPSYVYDDYPNKLYNMYLGDLGYSWISCGKYYSNTNSKTSITVTPNIAPNQSDNVEVRAFLVFKSINSVMSVSGSPIVSPQIPTGMDAVLVGVGVGKSKKVYFGKQSITISANMQVNLQMSVTTDTAVKQGLSNL